MDEDIFTAVLSEDLDKGEQYRIQIKHFRDKEWLHIRKYYLSFEGDWLPTKDGVSLPMEISTSLNLFKALVEIISLAESRDVLSLHFPDAFKEVYPDEGFTR